MGSEMCIRDRVPGLASRRAISRLWGLVDERLAKPDPGAVAFAERVARGLALAAPTDLNGLPLTEIHCAKPAAGGQHSPVGAWARLVVLEGQALSSSRARDFAKTMLMGGEVPTLRLAALRALLASRDLSTVPASFALPEERDLFLHAARIGAAEELPAALAGVGAVPQSPGAVSYTHLTLPTILLV